MALVIKREKPIRKSSDERFFYEELDENNSHQSCCTFPTLIFLFLFTLIFSVFLAFWTLHLLSKIKIPGINISKQTSAVEREIQNYFLTESQVVSQFIKQKSAQFYNDFLVKPLEVKMDKLIPGLEIKK